MQPSDSDFDATALSLDVKIFSPVKTFFNGRAKIVSATNKTGDFDILPQHHSFITILPAGTVRITTDEGGSKREFPIDGGLMRVRADVVTIFIGF